MDNDDIVDTLNKLIETCKDGEEGFHTCAEHAKSPQLKSVFRERAESCRKGAVELQAAVARLGGKPETDSSTAGSLHRGWVGLKSRFTSDDDQAVLDECERGEDAALERYRDAIKEDLPADIAALVERQYEGAKKNHDQIRALRNAMRSAKT